MEWLLMEPLVHAEPLPFTRRLTKKVERIDLQPALSRSGGHRRDPRLSKLSVPLKNGSSALNVGSSHLVTFQCILSITKLNERPLGAAIMADLTISVNICDI